MSAHARFSPSSADSWMLCHARMQLEESAGVPDRPGPEAELGTLGHAYAYELLRYMQNGEQRHHALADRHRAHLIRDGGKEQLEAADFYVDWLTQQQHAPLNLMKLEQRLEILMPHCWGTADACWWNQYEGYVADLKTGIGYVVPISSWQMKLYAVGLLELIRASGDRVPGRVTVIVVQPRAIGYPPVRSVTYELDELLGFVVELKAAVAAALGDEARYNPGPACRWCRAATVCPAIEAAAIDLAMLNVYQGKAEVMLHPDAISPGELSEKLTMGRVLVPWIKELERLGLEYLEAGGELDGFKLVHKRVSQQWAAPDEDVVAFANAEGFDPFKDRVLKTPKQARDLIAKDREISRGEAQAVLDEMVQLPEPGLTLADSADPREAVVPTAAKLANARTVLQTQR